MLEKIDLIEWQTIFVEGAGLTDNDARNAALILKDKRIIEIIELRDGISITSNSYVGRIKIGHMQINVHPKINGMPLYQLLKYTYGLRELKLFNTAEHYIANFQFFDLLIYKLYVEVEELLRRGIQKSYILKEEDLLSPRGRIDINRLGFQGGLIQDKLPCKYYNREENNILNKILLSGLKLALVLVVDSNLKNKLQRLCVSMQENIDGLSLTRGNLQLAKNSISRLTERYSVALEIINILFESQAIQLEDSPSRINLSGYFFDMNVFFETLVGRLLKTCSGEYLIKEQVSLHGMFLYTPGHNPCNKKSPTPRPDFALIKNGKVVKLLDAKYRDLWSKSLPREMLYQLAIYAVSGIGDKTATILYPSINDVPTIQKIEVRDPITNSKIASVILKPINLIKVADLLSKHNNELKVYIEEIIG